MSKLKDVKGSIHFMGILGAGCYPLAEILSGRGCRVTGTDAALTKEFNTSPSGIAIWRHLDALPPDTALAVYSLAIADTDRLVSDAESRAIPLVSRAQLLGALMSLYPIRISVSGSHGKSTVTAIAEHILAVSGIPHTAVSGAKLVSGRAYVDGGGDVFIAEACEYKDSFLTLPATHQLITSVELDHTDYFSDIDAVRRSFLLAARQSDTALINLDDGVSAKIANELKCGDILTKAYTPPRLFDKNRGKTPPRVITYGKDIRADYRIHSITPRGDATDFLLTHGGETIALTTSLIGEFNIYNVAAAVALTLELGIDKESAAKAVETFFGIERRLSLLTRIASVPVYYDYAHHPSEIAAVIRALKERYGAVSVIFRPHTYSRTLSLWRDFVLSLSAADRVVLLDVFPAREPSIEGVNSRRLAEDIPSAVYCEDMSQAASLAISENVGAVVLLGAGEVERVKRDLTEKGRNG